MRGILILCGAILVAAIVGAVLWLRRPAHYGEPFGDAETVQLSALASQPQDFENHRVHVGGAIVRQCPATGHWFFLKQEDGKSSPIKVEMDDSTLPQHVGGVAIVEGRMQRSGDGWRIAASSVEFRKDRP